MATLLSIDDKTKIQQTIAEVEKQSHAEIVVQVVPQSGRYDAYRAFAALLATFCTAFLGHELFPTMSTDWVISLQIPAYIGWWLLFGVAPILSALAPDSVEKKTVEEHAMMQFASKGVFETQQRTGVLIMISELERQVAIVADRGIHEKVGTDEWNKQVAHMVHAIRERRTADGIIQTVKAIGNDIAEAFPTQRPNTNELPNQVID